MSELASRTLRRPARVLSLMAEARPDGRGRAGAPRRGAVQLEHRLVELPERPQTRRFGKVFVGSPMKFAVSPSTSSLFRRWRSGSSRKNRGESNPVGRAPSRPAAGERRGCGTSHRSSAGHKRRARRAGTPRAAARRWGPRRGRWSSATRAWTSTRRGRGRRRSMRWRRCALSRGSFRASRSSRAERSGLVARASAGRRRPRRRTPSTRRSTTSRCSRNLPHARRRDRGHGALPAHGEPSPRPRVTLSRPTLGAKVERRRRSCGAAPRGAPGAGQTRVRTALIFTDGAAKLRGVPVPVRLAGDPPAIAAGGAAPDRRVGSAAARLAPP